jgi:hypothetical protein
VACLGAALALVAFPLAAQQRGVRFEIVGAADTTITLRAGNAGWLRAGLEGVAVDPRRRDVLVARFRLLRVGAETATAVLTGQTTVVTTDHVAIIAEPPRPWLRTRTFWAGLLAGAALGVLGSAVSR